MAKLYFYYAAMNAGKSTTLLQADFNYRERGMETMLWTAAHDDRSGAGTHRLAASRLSAPAHAYSPDDRPVRRGRRGAEAAQARLRAGRRGAVPDPRPCAAAVPRRRRARHPGALLRPAHRLPGQSVRRQRGAAGARRHAGRAEGGVRVRAQGDDEPARRCRRPCGRRRRADRDRRQRPLRRAVPPPLLRAVARKRSAPAEPRPAAQR